MVRKGIRLISTPERGTERRSLAALIAVLVAVLLQAGIAAGQAVQPSKAPGASLEVVPHKLKSVLMGREMPYKIALPKAYKDKGSSVRYPVIYLLHGLTGNHSNWFDRTRLAEYAADHNFIVVTPEGANGWYTDSVTSPNDKFESYIIRELIPEIDKTYRTIDSRQGRIIAGLSMGGYGSIKFGLKYPAAFSLVGSFSGALGAASFTEGNAGSIGKSIDLIFGTADSPSRASNDVFRLVRELTADKLSSIPFIYQSCGTEDFLIQNNRDFLSLVNEKKVPHEYREHPGGHDWKFWDRQVKDFLVVASAQLNK